MRGRYRLTAKERYLRDHFGLEEALEWSPHYNIAPTQQLPTIRQDAKKPRRVWATARWGLIPSWAKDPSIGFRTINAMSETAAEKPAFRDAMRLRRCLVPAEGFYEWKKLAKGKQPYNIGMGDDGVFAFAGLWERRRDAAAGDMLETCTILTTSPNAIVAGIHDRMPVILRPTDYDRWLDPGITNPLRVSDLLQPFDARLMRCYQVSERINRPENDDPECARQVPSQPVPRTLF
jgi:putative SOS response-associated peptidase YedK